MFAEGEGKQDNIQLKFMFAQNQEPAHLLCGIMSVQLVNQTVRLACRPSALSTTQVRIVRMLLKTNETECDDLLPIF